MKSKTPRTDAALEHRENESTISRLIALCRQLEREIDDVRQILTLADEERDAALAENVMLKQCNGQLNAMIDAKPKTMAAMPND